MARTNIKTATVAVGTDYAELDISLQSVFTIQAIGCDLHVCTGKSVVGDATEADSFFLPAGAALEMNPVPLSPVFVKGSVAGSASMWYA